MKVLTDEDWIVVREMATYTILHAWRGVADYLDISDEEMKRIALEILKLP